VSEDRRDIHDLFQRDMDRIELPPPGAWMPGAKRPTRSPWRSLIAVPAAAGAIVLALVLAFLIQVARGELPQVAKSPTPAPSIGAASPSALPTPNPSPMGPSPLASPTARPLAPSTAVRIDKTLPASGQWALVLRRAYNRTPIDPNQASGPRRTPTIDSISATPLSARATTPRDTLALLSFTSQSTEGGLVTDNLLREQFSPDGRRLVLSVVTGSGASSRLGLVIVDLVAGTALQLTGDPAFQDGTPAWSPGGDEIAFARTTVGRQVFHDAGIWTIRADGTGLRRVLDASGAYIYSWNGDGTGIAYVMPSADASYNVLDLASGRHARVSPYSVQTGRGMGDWRVGTPAFVGGFARSSHGGEQILLTAADQHGAGAREIARETPLNRYFGGARWRPGSNDILYVKLFQDPNVEIVGGSPTAPKNTRTIYVTDASGRAPKAVATKVYENVYENVVAAWSPDGRDIVYLSGQGAAGALVLIAPDGTNERVVQAWGGAPESVGDWLDLAVLSL
jgi:dipeptidyl aminopeptidase/acylaminoacyl peptidase